MAEGLPIMTAFRTHTPMRALVCLTVLLGSVPALAQSSGGPTTDSWVVVPVEPGDAEDPRATQLAVRLREALGESGVAVLDDTEAGEIVEERVSAPVSELSESDINAWASSSQAALRALARADYDNAREALVAAQEVAQRAAETPPTIFLGVPSLFEALLRQIRRNAQGGIRGAYFSAASWFNALLIRTVGVNLGRVLFRPVQKALGGRLRFMVSGGSRLDPEVHRGMMAIGLPVIQGYGLSEAAAVVSAQRFNHGEFWWRARGYWRNVGSVGPAAEGVTVSISPHESSKGHGEGELTVQGPNVMMGYYQRPDDTKLMIQDGLLQTGDIARIDNDGSIWITGRASLVISMPNGKLVNLETFEAQLSLATEIGQVRLTIEQEPKWQLIATVFPSIDALVDGNIENNNDLHRLMREVVRRQSLSLPSWLRVDEVRLVDETLPVTRLGKLRRVELPDHSFDFDHWSAAALELSQS